MADVNMLPLISRLRTLGSAATDDVFNGVTYWTDDQLEDILMLRGTYATVKLVRYTDTIYRLDNYGHYGFRADVTVFKEIDDTVADAATFTYDPRENSVVFDTGRTEDALWLRGFVVNLYDAAADLWDLKAGQREGYVNFRAGHNVMNMRESYEHCVERASTYRNKIVRRYARG